ncbi:MAG: DNA alkylation repair protein [Bacteroidetes bacterium HGW-Bacteroidetes-16]|jgi:3-methyladenine DNA glycosylase AlkD|nr:MAG: DNA alkylation repair protein [Bacteroidetes bacterium HGW-Bacteroidetes-16]
MKDHFIEDLRESLRENADEKTRESALRFFKEEVHFYGVKSTIIHQISNEHFKSIKNKPKAEIFELCETLWQSGLMEESIVACNWSYYLRKKYESSDFKLFEKWVNAYVTNWASCDTFCNHTVGSFIEMYPHFIHELKNWALSPNRWMRRAASVSLIIPAKKGLFLNDIFEIATILLTDTDDMVQKGYGWMLKVACKQHEPAVFDYIMKHKTTMPRTALRYAIEKMPAELKAIAMAK